MSYQKNKNKFPNPRSQRFSSRRCIASLEVESTFVLFLRIVLALRSPLRVHANLRISLSVSTEMLAMTVFGIELNLQISLGRNAIVTMSGLWFHSHCIFLHLSRSFEISLIRVVELSISGSRTSFVKFIPKYLIGFMRL